MSRSGMRAGAVTAAAIIMSGVLVGGCFGDQGNVFSLAAGDCFDDPDVETDEVSNVAVVDCDERHDNEVYAAFDAPGSDYPGSEELLATANEGCLARFTMFVGVSFDVSELDATFLAPTERSWKDHDDREVVCYLFDESGAKLEGSMRDVGR